MTVTHTYPPDPPAQRGCHVTEKEDAQHLTPSLQHCSLSTKTGPTVIWSLRGHGGEKFSLSFSFHLIHSDQSQLFLSLPSSHGILGRPEKAFQVVALRLSHSLSFFSEKVPWEKEGGKDALARYMPGMELQREDLFRSAKHFPPYSLFVFISMKAAGRKRVSERGRVHALELRALTFRSLFSEILPSLYLLLSHIQCHIREATVSPSLSVPLNPRWLFPASGVRA